MSEEKGDPWVPADGRHVCERFRLRAGTNRPASMLTVVQSVTPATPQKGCTNDLPSSLNLPQLVYQCSHRFRGAFAGFCGKEAITRAKWFSTIFIQKKVSP